MGNLIIIELEGKKIYKTDEELELLRNRNENTTYFKNNSILHKKEYQPHGIVFD